jgi:hypothetical protein
MKLNGTAPLLGGKVVMDAANLFPQRDGAIVEKVRSRGVVQ